MAVVHKTRTQTELDRRNVAREELYLGVTLYRVGEGEVVPAAIANLSVTGFLAELPPGAAVPEFLDVELPNAGRRKAQVVWQSGSMAGCTFTVPLSRADVSAARLKSAVRVPQAPAASRPDAATPLATFEIGPSDPIWDMMNEAAGEEKWPTRSRLALIAAAALVPWVPLVGLAVMLA